MSVDLDAKVELGQFSAHLGGHLSAIREELQAIREAQVPPRVPTFHPLLGSFTSTGKTYGFIYLDGPTSSASIWEVRRLWITTADPFAAPAATVALFVATAGYNYIESNTEPGTFPELLEPNGPIPNSTLYGSGQALLLPGQKVALIIKGATNGQQFTAGGLAMGYDLKTWASSQ